MNMKIKFEVDVTDIITDIVNYTHTEDDSAKREEIKEEFPNVQFSILETIETELNEGKYHIGRANVVRFIAKKHC